MNQNPLYQRIVYKLSGEALTGGSSQSISPEVLDRFALEIKAVHDMGVEVAIVIGGGNLVRGESISDAGLGRVTGDFMGMLATLMNGLALRDTFERAGMACRILSSIPVNGIVDSYHYHKARHHLDQKRVVIFVGGTGNPLVTTDSAAALRAIEIEADVLIKATSVDGIYSSDPSTDPNAKFLSDLSFDEVLKSELKVMDLAAFCQCRDFNIPIRVFNLNIPGNIVRVVTDHSVGSIIS